MSRVNLKITKENDIRRISVLNSIPYPEFIRTLGYLFGPLPEGYVLKYVDEEKDLVSITNERELREAIASATGAVLKLSVIPPASEEENEDVGPAYHEAYCNHCGVDIYGVRYKCGNCADFDLCEACEAHWSTDFSVHDVTHTFLKIYTPLPDRFTDKMIIPHNLYEVEEEVEVVKVAPPTPAPRHIDVGGIESDWALQEIESAMLALDESQKALRKMSLEQEFEFEPEPEPESESEPEVQTDEWTCDEILDEDLPVFSLELPVEYTEGIQFTETFDSIDSLPQVNVYEAPEETPEFVAPQEPLVELPVLVAHEEVPQAIMESVSEPEDVPVSEPEVIPPAPVVPDEQEAEPQEESVVVSFWKKLQNIFSPEVEWRDEWNTLLAQMEDMGFTDKERCKQTLASHRGNVNSAVEALLQN